MSLSIPIPLPGDRLGNRIVIASVFFTDEVATVVLLNPAVPYFAVGQVNLDTGELLGVLSEHHNIVPAVREYEQMGGDY